MNVRYWVIQTLNPLSFLIVCLFILNGCCGWTGPTIYGNTQGLGQGQIAEYLRRQGWANSEDWLSKKIMEMLIIENKHNQPRASAESVGMICDTPPSKVCRYIGVLSYQAYPRPNSYPDEDKLFYTLFEVILPDLDVSNTLIVKKTEMVLGD